MFLLTENYDCCNSALEIHRVTLVLLRNTWEMAWDPCHFPMLSHCFHKKIMIDMMPMKLIQLTYFIILNSAYVNIFQVAVHFSIHGMAHN